MQKLVAMAQSRKRLQSLASFFLGEVLEQRRDPCQYLIKWKDESTQVQEVMHMFGKLTKKRGLRHGDHVLALAVPSKCPHSLLTVSMPRPLPHTLSYDIYQN